MAKMNIIWTKPALDDLNEIAEYIGLDNPTAAKVLVQTIFDKIERLSTFPESGRVPPELPQLSYREVVISPCRIFYKIENNEIIVLFVMREERDLRKFLLKAQQ